MKYKHGDRVQLTRYALKNQMGYKSVGVREKTEATCGVIVNSTSPVTLRDGSKVNRWTVRWITGVSFPPDYPGTVREDHIEPFGTKR